MPFTLTMPKLSPTMEAGTIVKWRKKEGDLVKDGEVIFEVATDKATVEHSVLDGGYLRKILVKEGGEATVNQAVAIFTTKADESIEGYKPEGEVVKKVAPEPKKEEKTVKKEEISAPVFKEPSFVPEPPLKKFASQGAASGKTIASPLAKKLAKEKGIDLSTIEGTGPAGRVTSKDIDLGQPDLLVTFGRKEQPSASPGSYEEEALTPMRKVIGQRLQQSKSFIPHFYVTQKINMDALEPLKEQLASNGLKLSVNDFITRATALALREHPHVNSGFNSANQSIIRFKTVDIAIAVSIDGGLITPIIRHADFKSLGELSSEVKSLAKRAKEGKLEREEYMGGSFTISNLGMYGVNNFVAVINPPQAAILAVGGIEVVPIVKEGQIQIGKVMEVTLSADHRVIDGTDAAKFLKTLKQLLESPALLLV